MAASAFSIAGFSVASRFSGVIGPTSLNAMRPPRGLQQLVKSMA